MPKFRVNLDETMTERFVMEVEADNAHQAYDIAETARINGELAVVDWSNGDSRCDIETLPADHVLVEPERPVGRFATTFRDREPLNSERAEWAMEALRAFMAITCFRAEDRDDPDTQREQAGDLICNLLHAFCGSTEEATEMVLNQVAMFNEDRLEEAAVAA